MKLMGLNEKLSKLQGTVKVLEDYGVRILTVRAEDSCAYPEILVYSLDADHLQNIPITHAYYAEVPKFDWRYYLFTAKCYFNGCIIAFPTQYEPDPDVFTKINYEFIASTAYSQSLERAGL